MMKRFLLALAALALAFPAAAFEYKTVDVRRTGNSPVRESFYAGDSIGFGYYLTENNETYDLTEWDMVTWEIASYTNSAECWMSVTGRIDNAEGGEISVETMLPLSVVPVGQYKGYVKAVKLTAGGDAVASQRTVVEQTVQVRYGNTELSPDAIDPSDLIAQGAFVRQAALDAETAARIGADESLSNAVAGVRADVDGMGETVAAISNAVAGLDGDLPDFSQFATKEWTETNYIQRELVEKVREEHSGGRVDTNEVLTVFYDSPGQSLYVKHLRVDELTDYNGNAIAGTGSGSGGGTVSGDYLPAVKMPDGLYHVDEGAGTAFGNGVSVEGDFGVDGDASFGGDVQVQAHTVEGATAYLLDSEAYAEYGPDAYADYNGLVQWYSQNRTYPYGLALNTLGNILRLAVRGDGAYIDRRKGARGGSSRTLGAETVTATGTVEVGVLNIGGGSYDKLRGRLHGGYFLTPARWAWQTRTAYDNATNYSGTLQMGSVMVVEATMTRTYNARIVPDIFRNEEWEPFEIDETSGPAELAEDADGGWRIVWDDPYSEGDIFTAKAHLGAWEESVTVTNSGSSLTNMLIAMSATPGSLRERMEEIKREWMELTGRSISRFKNFGRDAAQFEVNTNFWASELDLSGVSVWNNDTSYYYTKPLTLLSSNIAFGARHWMPAVGRTYGWFGRDGVMHYSKVVDVKSKTPDLGVARLDPPLDTDVVATYGILSDKVRDYRLGCGIFGHHAFWRGDQEYRPYAKQPLVACAQSARAFLMSTEDFNCDGSIVSEGFLNVDPVYPPECFPTGPWEPIAISRKEAVGGDSGHPVFAWDGEELALAGCYWKTIGAPHAGYWLDEIKTLVAAAGGDPEAVREVEYDDWPDYHSWELDNHPTTPPPAEDPEEDPAEDPEEP